VKRPQVTCIFSTLWHYPTIWAQILNQVEEIYNWEMIFVQLIVDNFCDNFLFNIHICFYFFTLLLRFLCQYLLCKFMIVAKVITQTIVQITPLFIISWMVTWRQVVTSLHHRCGVNLSRGSQNKCWYSVY